MVKGQPYALSDLLPKKASSFLPPSSPGGWLRSATFPEPLEKRTSFAWNETVVQPHPSHSNDYSIFSRLSKMKSLIFFIKFLCYSSYLEREKQWCTYSLLVWSGRLFRVLSPFSVVLSLSLCCCLLVKVFRAGLLCWAPYWDSYQAGYQYDQLRVSYKTYSGRKNTTSILVILRINIIGPSRVQLAVRI
jgi:hypothetical protein